MFQIDLITDAIQAAGTLPISQESVDYTYAAAPESQESLLHNFAIATQSGPLESNSDGHDALMKLVLKNQKSNGKIEVKPVEESTYGSSSYGDTGVDYSYSFTWFWDTDYFSVDLFGANEPTYGLQRVEVTGQRIEENWNFPYMDIDHNLFIYIVDNGEYSETPAVDCSTQNENGSQKIKWSVIEGFEGNLLSGYVPLKNGVPFALSGVTVASGFDLGSRNSHGLTELGLSASLITALTPYLGLKGQAAYTKELATPLVITAAQATELNTASHSATLTSIVVAYDKAVGAGSFYTLPSEAQTVIASMAFQRGNLAIATPDFWVQVTSKDWTAAEANLRNFGDAFKTRRTAEADLLKAAKTAGTLHDGLLC